MLVAPTGMAPLDASAVGGVVETEAILALADLWLRGIWDCRGRRLEEAEGADFLREGDDPAGKGWVKTVGVHRGGYLNRGDTGLSLHLFTNQVSRDGNSVALKVS